MIYKQIAMAGIFLIILIILIDLVFIGYFFLYGLFPFAFKGAIFVPTPRDRIDRMIELAELKPGEKAVDLGSGDGRLLLALAKKGIECHGFEINPILAAESQRAIKKAGLENLAFVHLENLWDQSLADYNAAFIYPMGHMLLDLEQKLAREMPKGSRAVLYAFSFPNILPERKERGLYLYRIN